MIYRCLILAVLGAIMLATPEGATGNDQYWDFMRKMEKAAILIRADTGQGARAISQGSGVVTIIGGRKWVLTAYHVIEGQRRAQLISLGDKSNGMVYRDARWHVRYDIAALPLPSNMNHLPTFPLTDGYLRKGAPIHVAAFPRGEAKVTHGFVTSYNNPYNDPLPSQVVFTAAVKPGASGGMILSHDGRLAGIATSSYVYTDLHGNQTDGQGIGTPAYVIIDLIQQSIRNQGR